MSKYIMALDSGTTSKRCYEFPEAIKTELYEFNIPLATPGGEYMVEVEP